MSHLMRSLMRRYMEEADDGTKGGAGGNNPPVKTEEKQTFSHEYVKELREENKNWRLKVSGLEQERDTHKAAAETAKTEAEKAIEAAKTAANDRILRSELKAEAIKAGMIDLDGLKLADLSKVTLKEDGTIEGAEDMFKALKESKAYLFGVANTTSSTKTPPNPKQNEAKKATEMTDEEYAAARKQIK